jgi:hypothetical protein
MDHGDAANGLRDPINPALIANVIRFLPFL